MDRFRASVEAVRRGEPPPEDGYQGDYVAELAREAGDPVPRMLERIEATLERFRIHFDRWAKQSELERGLPALLAQLDDLRGRRRAYVRSTEFGDEKDRVLVRSADKGGLPTTRPPTSRTSATSSSAATTARSTCSAPTITASRSGRRRRPMLGYDPERIEVLLYQFVHLTSGGEQAKMSKRSGDVVFLDEFMDEVGVDAARWFLVNRGPDQTIEIAI